MLRLAHSPSPSAGTVKIALSILCENPNRKTGLTTLFHEFVRESLALEPGVEWIVFAGPKQTWTIDDPRVRVVRDFPANDRLQMRLLADHFRVPGRARELGATVLLTVGFVPLRKTLPTVMHMLSLQHLDRSNRVGFLRQFYRRWMARRGFTDAEMIVTNSECARDQILADEPYCGERLFVSYEGLQHAQFHPRSEPDEAVAVEEKFGLRPDYLLWVSNFYPYKQAVLLLEGYALLEPALRNSMPLLMVGGDWENRVELAKARARTLGILDDVKFVGWVGDEWLAPLFRQARIFALPSREETFGRCVLEAMACGTPCLVNDIPIMHEVTAEHAEIVDFRDAQAVAAALRRLISDAALRENLRSAGIRRADDFSFEKLTRERLNIIRAAAGQVAR